jgi:hypothetical protein
LCGLDLNVRNLASPRERNPRALFSADHLANAFGQNRHFDIAGPNPTPKELRYFDEQYTLYLDTQRREAVAAAFCRKAKPNGTSHRTATFKPKLQADLLTRPVQQLMGMAWTIPNLVLHDKPVANMRTHDRNHVFVNCGNPDCYHNAELDVSGLPDNVTFRELQRRMLCTVCDHRGADVGPSWLHHG